MPEENKISSKCDITSGGTGIQKNNINMSGSKPTVYYSRTTVNGNSNDAPLSPMNKDRASNGPGGGGGGITQTSRNMSVLNIKKSSARFLSPLNNN